MSRGFALNLAAIMSIVILLQLCLQPSISATWFESDSQQTKRTDGFVEAYSSSPPNEQWRRFYDSSYSFWWFMQSGDGGFILIGDYAINSENSDILAAKTDSYGNIVWLRIYRTPNYDDAWGAVPMPDGGFLISGSSFGTDSYTVLALRIGSSGDRIWMKTYETVVSDIYSLTKPVSAIGGGYAIAGTSRTISGENSNWLMKISENGDLLNFHENAMEGIVSFSTFNDIVQTLDGYVTVGAIGYTGGGHDALWVKMGGSGSIVWMKTYDGNQREAGNCVGRTADGGFILGGISFDPVARAGKVLVIKINATGNSEWVKTYQENAHQGCSTVVCSRDGGYVFGGATAASFADRRNPWLFKIDFGGNMQWSKTLEPIGEERMWTLATQTSDDGYALMCGGMSLSGNTMFFGTSYLIKLSPEGGGQQVSVKKIEAIQVVYNEPLVANKETVFRVSFTNTFREAKLIHLRLTWGAKGKTPYTKTVQMIVWPGETSQFMGDWWNILPEAGTFVASATIEESGSTASTGDIQVKATSGLKIMYAPVLFPSELGIAVAGPKMSVERTGMGTFILATYPVSKDKFSSGVSDGFVFTPASEWFKEVRWRELKLAQTELAVRGFLGGYDRVIGVVPSYGSSNPSWFTKWFSPELTGCAGIHDLGSSVVFVEQGFWTAAAHEIGHSYGMWTNQYEEYQVYNLGKPASGYWAHVDDWDFNPANGHMASGPIRENAVCFMGMLAPYQKYAETVNSELRQVWVDNEDYEHLLRSLCKNDPEVLFLSGNLFRNGTVNLNPWYKLANRTADIELGAFGNYSVLFKDAQGNILGQTGFNVSMTTNGVDLNMTCFNFAVPYVSNTTQIQIAYGETVVASRSISPSSPVVTLNSPNGGEAFAEGQNASISWNGSDLDDDDIVYSVLYSPDNGSNWIPLATNLNATTCVWNINCLGQTGGNQYLVKVIASDGIRTGEAVSNATFTVLRHDLAVTQITTSKARFAAGFVLPINVTVENKGNYLETAIVEILANSTVIQNRTLALLAGESGCFTFSWNTTGLTDGNYTITAKVKQTSGELDTSDNQKAISVQIVSPNMLGGVAVSDMRLQKTIVGQGCNLTGICTVQNLESLGVQTNLTIELNCSIICVLQVDLNSLESKQVSFSCITTAMPHSAYTITVFASPVFNETETEDNLLQSNTLVTVPGDTNGDHTVNVLDLILIASHLGHTDGDGHMPYSSDWYQCMNTDVQGDGQHNVLDLILCANHLGESWA